MSAPRTIEKCDPPEDSRLSPYWIEVNQLVRADPGTWFNLGDYSASVGSQIKEGKRPSLIPDDVPIDKRAAYMAKHYEVKTERVAGGRRLIKIRFLG